MKYNFKKNLSRKIIIFMLNITGFISFTQNIDAMSNREAIIAKSYDKEFMDTLKNEVLKSFTLEGHPITPKAFQVMEQWASDRIPGIIAIDLIATIGSNQFFGDFTSKEWKNVTWHEIITDEGRGEFKYAFIGKIGSDKCVIATTSNSGGSGTWAYLIILKIEIDHCIDCNNAGSTSEPQNIDQLVPRYRIIAKIIGELGLGMVGDFELKNDMLTIKREDFERTQIIDLSKFTEL